MPRIIPAAIVCLLALAGPGSAPARAAGTEFSRVENTSFSDRWLLTLVAQTGGRPMVGKVRILTPGNHGVLATLERLGQSYAIRPRQVVEVETAPGSEGISIALRLIKGRGDSAQAADCYLQQSPWAAVPSIRLEGAAEVRMNPVFFGYPDLGPWITIE